ncbi:MAG: hypothetical protein L6R42_010202 [Xanthoria sp. 1 TBL-2021]|nr:MAG: hypothetical protein L6R42_010202 [Xanthoria sp. 1 TBL-2021]
MANESSADVKKIFQPLITDIERMVEDQVNLVRVKRLNEGHPKANEIKLPEEAAITSTVLIKHYGVSVNATYDEKEDAGQPTTIHKYNGKTRVEKMYWYIHRGEDMRRDQKIIFPFKRSLADDYSPSKLIFSDDLLEC